MNYEDVKPYCICIKINKKIFNFWYSENLIINFLEFLVNNIKDEKINIYTHNINFDGLVILDNIREKNIFFDFFIRDHNLYWIKIYYCNFKVLIRCSYKIIPISVKSLGVMLKFQKQIFPYKFIKLETLEYFGNIPNESFFNSKEDYELFKKENEFLDVKNKTIEYCNRDVEIVYTVLNEIIKIIKSFSKNTQNIINNSFSFSSISYKIFIMLYDSWKIDETKNDINKHNYIINSYCGGRCEVFGNPTKDFLVHYFDYTGMYSQCMTEEFPIGDCFFEINKNFKEIKIFEIGFHTIKFKCNDYLPFLPYKFNKLLFPNGEMVGVYWYEEIINAVKQNKCEILEHYSSLMYKKKDYIFKNYVEFFSKIRKKGVYYNIFGKNIVNGLYGSFALNEKEESYLIAYSKDELNTYIKSVNVKSWKMIGSFFLISVVIDDKSKKIIDKKNKWNLTHKKRNVAYAAIISSKARIKLNNSLQRVLEDNGELYYTDTDSIFAGYKVNKLNSKLGDIVWSEIYQDAVFISSKFYFLYDKKLRLKGIGYNDFSFYEIKKMFYHNKEKIVFKNQKHFDKKDFKIYQKDIDKIIFLNEQDKRTFTPNKKKTEPIYINPY